MKLCLKKINKHFLISAMSDNSIQIYARVRPSRNPLPGIEIDDDKIKLKVPKSDQGLINHQKENYNFQFNSVFQDRCSQVEVFDKVALKILLHVMEGYHGTIFCYGQTGTGKTYTMTGGNENYQQRGLMPRAIEFIYSHILRHSEYKYDVGCSYLEIYNENGYDLLDDARDASKLEELKRVNILEDEAGNFHLKNLRIMPSNSEDDAMNFLYLGDTNKMMAETPSNPQSSRSHCVFTLHVQRSEPGSSKITKSLLHLVDLAGSERVSRTGIDGRLLKEAKHINLSLHYLEQVIISLQDKGRKKHVPYRNSMLTCILREALGGNCKTTMIATFANEEGCLEEGISTFRFAQRVALVSNNAHINEELDPTAMIHSLKVEIKNLKCQLSMLTEGHDFGDLTDIDTEYLDEKAKNFIEKEISATDLITPNLKKLEYLFNVIRNKFTEKRSAPKREDSGKSNFFEISEIKRLNNMLFQRDQEIKILLDSQSKAKPLQTVSKQMESFKSFDTNKKEEYFEEFKKQYDRLQWIEDLKKKYNSTVLSAQSANKKLALIKSQIQKEQNHSSPECIAFIQEYKAIFDSIKEKKRILDHNKHLLEKSKSQLKNDFEAWLLKKQSKTSNRSEFEQLKQSFTEQL
eukprot:NODE_126_length_17250_cov_2.558743.p1 type:complete len:632 gc:universal NODE_126_length_17250_cov_2.558743:2564-4459(+)